MNAGHCSVGFLVRSACESRPHAQVRKWALCRELWGWEWHMRMVTILDLVLLVSEFLFRLSRSAKLAWNHYRRSSKKDKERSQGHDPWYNEKIEFTKIISTKARHWCKLTLGMQQMCRIGTRNLWRTYQWGWMDNIWNHYQRSTKNNEIIKQIYVRKGMATL